MPAEPHILPHNGGQREVRQRGRAVAALAAAQHGVVARKQLREIGLSDAVVDRWLANGRLLPVSRGVHAVGRRPLTLAGRWMAAVLAGGAGAVLSHRSAGFMWDLAQSPGRHIEVTTRTNRRRPDGAIVHVRKLPPDETTLHQRIPVTTVSRTLFDLACSVSGPRLQRAIALAEARGLADPTPLPELMERYRGHRGVARLRAALAAGAFDYGVADQELEARFAEFLERHGFPEPLKNAPIDVGGGRTLIVDCLWPEPGVVVELDSRKHHADWESAEADRARDAALVAIGLLPMRVTWRRLHAQPEVVARELWAALQRASRSPR